MNENMYDKGLRTFHTLVTRKIKHTAKYECEGRTRRKREVDERCAVEAQ